jgi:hypothetical protein
VLSGSGKQFEVTFSSDKQAIDLVTGKPYTAVGGELTPGDGTNKDAAKSTATVYIDGKQVTLLAYNIGGNNFFKLRSLGKALDFSVTFDSATNSISVDTTKGYTA